jgi:hypothetical protein
VPPTHPGAPTRQPARLQLSWFEQARAVPVHPLHCPDTHESGGRQSSSLAQDVRHALYAHRYPLHPEASQSQRPWLLQVSPVSHGADAEHDVAHVPATHENPSHSSRTPVTHERGPQWRLLHRLPALQSASVLHQVAHDPPLQRYGPHGASEVHVATTHAPAVQA